MSSKKGKYKDLFERIKKVPLKSIKGTFYRIKAKDHKILDDSGSIKGSGGRYNSKSHRALYLGESINLCKSEIKRHSKELLIKTEGFKPFSLGEVEISLEKVLDLTDENILNYLKIKRKDLIKADYTFTQELGEIAKNVKIEAIKVPSVTSKGNNLVIFKENVGGKSNIRLKEKRTIKI
jgi:RES domain-containing protein